MARAPRRRPRNLGELAAGDQLAFHHPGAAARVDLTVFTAVERRHDLRGGSPHRAAPAHPGANIGPQPRGRSPATRSSGPARSRPSPPARASLRCRRPTPSRAAPRPVADRLLGHRGAEGDLSAQQSACHYGLTERHGIDRFVDLHYRRQPDLPPMRPIAQPSYPSTPERRLPDSPRPPAAPRARPPGRFPRPSAPSSTSSGPWSSRCGAPR